MKKIILLLFSLLLVLSFGSCDTSRTEFGDSGDETLCPHTSIEKTVMPPTCDIAGQTKNRCTSCGYEYISDFVQPKGHSLAASVTEPSCDTQGYTVFYCSCGFSYTSEYIPSSEHTLECEIKVPTCTEHGETRNFCTKCDYEYISDFTPPTGHTFTETVLRPTATSAGYTLRECHCSYSYRGDYIYYSDILESAYTENTEVLAKGMDISRWNHQIGINGEYLPLDFNTVRSAGFDFVILKAGSTQTGEEPTFRRDYHDAKAAGLEVGVYYYTYAKNDAEILADAQLLLNIIEGMKFEYPIYLDLEDDTLKGLGKNHLSSMCEVFLEELQANGYYAGLYTNHDWLTTVLDTARMVTLFDIWYARYPGTTVPTWSEEKYGKQLGMWQYTDKGEISGINGNFDFNYAYKDYSAIMETWHLNGY